MANSITFTDMDPDAGQISGTVFISRADEQSDITYYRLYYGTNADTISGFIAEIQKEESLAYKIDNNTSITSNDTHLIVKTGNSSGEMTNGISCALIDNRPGNSDVAPPVISSFTSDYSIILTQSSVRDFTQLAVTATDNIGIASYAYVVISGNDFLLGSDTADGKIYFAGNEAETVQIRVTVTDTSGNTAEETLSIYVKENGYQKISDIQGGFTGTLIDENGFGLDITNLGDLDGDGVTDLAVGAWSDDDGGTYRGAVWILFLNTNGTVKSYQKISSTQGNFVGTLDNNDQFGIAVTSIGDLDNDSVTDLAVGARCDYNGYYANIGAVWVLFLNSNGTVKSHYKISGSQDDFNGILNENDNFGHSVSNIGDLDQDGVTDIAVGAIYDNYGSIWILFLNSNGTIKRVQ